MLSASFIYPCIHNTPLLSPFFQVLRCILQKGGGCCLYYLYSHYLWCFLSTRFHITQSHIKSLCVALSLSLLSTLLSLSFLHCSLSLSLSLCSFSRPLNDISLTCGSELQYIISISLDCFP
jgi:hypothetical protein